MIPRTLEPEVMDSAAEARDYDSMDHSQVNRIFVDDFLEACHAQRTDSTAPNSLITLDVGTGTALIPIELCRRSLNLRIMAIDLANEMLRVARENVDRAGLKQAIRLVYADAKQLPCQDASFDAVVSNSILHHIPQPQQVLAQMLRVLRPGGMLFVRDLLRPNDLQSLESLVAAYAGHENPHQQQMFRDSLHAALSLDELQLILRTCNVPSEWAKQTSDRHWTLVGRLP